MNSMLRTLVTSPVVLLMCSCCSVSSSRSEDNSSHLVSAYLQKQYPGLTENEGGYSLSGLGYSPAKAPLKIIRSDVLKTWYPDISFFQTYLLNSNFEYMNVEAIVSLKQSPNGYMLHDVLSPTFTDVSESFTAQFLNVRPESREDQEALCLAISDLLKRITYEGNLRGGQFDGNAYQIQLWHGRLHWRDLRYEFLGNGYLQSIRVTKPKDDARSLQQSPAGDVPKTAPEK